MIVEGKSVAYSSAGEYIWKNKEEKGYKGNVNLNFIEPVFVWFKVIGIRMIYHQYI